MKTTETACVSNDVLKKKKKKKSDCDFRRFAYKPCTGSFSYFKLANSLE